MSIVGCFMVVGATCLGDDFYEAAEKKSTPDTWDIGEELKLLQCSSSSVFYF